MVDTKYAWPIVSTRTVDKKTSFVFFSTRCSIKGLMYMTRAILPTMVSQGGGHIINIVCAAIPAHVGDACHFQYRCCWGFNG
jgi:hypothetical protein